MPLTPAAAPAPAGTPHEGVRQGSGSASGRAAEVRAGARALIPVLVGYAPLALLVGSAVSASDSPLVAWIATWTVYSGAAQLAILDVVAGGGGAAAAVVAGLAINARLMAYSMSLAADWRGTTRTARVLAAVALTDVPFALTHGRGGDARSRRYFYAGAALAMWLGWVGMVSLGALTGRSVALLPGSDLAAPLVLGALLVTRLRDRATVAACAAALATSTVTASLSAGPAMLLTIAAGTTGALLAGGGRSSWP